MELSLVGNGILLDDIGNSVVASMFDVLTDYYFLSQTHVGENHTEVNYETIN